MDDDELYDEFWEHREASKKLNGLFTNRIYALPMGDGLVRINFGEALDEDPAYHTAIVMTASRAVEFAQLIFDVGNAILAAERQAALALETVAPPPTAPIVPTAPPQSGGPSGDEPG